MNGISNRNLPFMHNNKSSLNQLYSSKEFELLLQRERARSDRSGSEFSLIVYAINGQNGRRKPLQGFLHALRRRIRTVDEIGWFQDHSIGVLLPFSNRKGASSFAEDVAKLLSKKAKPFPYSIYSYPSRWYKSGAWDQIGNGQSPTKKLVPADPKEKNCRPRARLGNQATSANVSAAIDAKIDSVLAGKYPGWKRAMDFAGALLGILLSSPILLLLFAFIKTASPGPALFRQSRVGYKGRLFTFLKIRTMHLNNDITSHRAHLKSLIRSDVPMLKLDTLEDPRIIIGGKILRRTCLDELPQLFNVLKGEMSLVGPRPCLPYEVEEYERWHAHRFDVKPGMTGLWQVSGKNNLTFQQMIRLDIAYSTSISFIKDIKILLLTGPAIIGFVIEAIGKRIGSWRTRDQRKTDVDSMAVG
jgi:lipopolysaccharide/colanic/teichoic acid biosynthesis glycosyltransferase